MLIPTKLSIPPIRHNAIDRPRLLQQLDKGKDRRLISISGPAGSGKTSLACQWLISRKCSVAWYALSDSDNEVDTFYQYLLTSLIRLHPKLDTLLSPHLQENIQRPGQQIATVIITAVNEITADANSIDGDIADCYITLEDYHLISNPEIHQTVEFLINHAPSHLHIIFISRYALPFPIAKWQARDEIVEIETRDLLFTLDEILTFYRQVMKIKLQRSVAESLFKITEGWAAGLQLAGLVLRKTEPEKQLQTIQSMGSASTITDYFMEEVLRDQPQEVEDFLLSTAILDRFNSDLAGSITGLDNAYNLLNTLEKDNFFIISLDNNHHWFRYHHIFADALQQKLRQQRPDQIAELHKKAALWYAQHQLFEEAFSHGFASKDYEFTAELLEKHLQSYLDVFGSVIVQRTLTLLPKDIFLRHCNLRLCQMVSFLMQWDITSAKKALADIEHDKAVLLAGLSDSSQMYFFHVMSFAQHMLGLIQNPIAIDLQALINLSKKHPLGHREFRDFMTSLIGWHYVEKGELNKANETISKAIVYERDNKSPFGTGVMLRQKAHIELQRGSLKLATKTLDQEFRLAEHCGLNTLPIKSFVHLMKARISYFHTDTRQGLVYIEDAVAYLEEISSRDFLCDAYIYQGFILQAQGEKSAATSVMKKALFIAQQIESPYFTAFVEVQLAQLALLQNNASEAEQWADRRNLDIREAFSEKLENEVITLAHLKLIQGQEKEALELLEVLRIESLKRQRLMAVLHIDILRAAALYSNQEPHMGLQQALPVLETAVEFAASEGFIQPFVNLSDYIAEPLQALEQNSEDSIRLFARILSDACRKADAVNQPTSLNYVEQLTQRELEVMKMIAQGDSNQAIAKQLNISINTVKYYLKNTYGKLGVNSRVQAVTHARLLKIL